MEAILDVLVLDAEILSHGWEAVLAGIKKRRRSGAFICRSFVVSLCVETLL